MSLRMLSNASSSLHQLAEVLTPSPIAASSGNRGIWPLDAAPRGLASPCTPRQICGSMRLASGVEVGTYVRVTAQSLECLSGLLAFCKAANFGGAVFLICILSAQFTLSTWR